jgi:NRPS condensation-like uncharacterized protein
MLLSKYNRGNMEKVNWYRLDNSAMIYPMVITQKTQSLYRLGVALNEQIDVNFLRIGLTTALERLPFFKVELKHGLFRHYLDENLHYPIVEKNDGNLLRLLNFKHNRHYLFRLSYYENKIFLDLFHGLCDGTGGMEFLKTIIYYYFKSQNRAISKENVITMSTPVKEGEIEDAFLKYYKKIDLITGTKKMVGGHAFCVKSKQFKGEGLGLIQAITDTDKLLDICHKYKCTMTVFLAALALYNIAIHNDNKCKENYIAFIPINLRKFYKTNTIGNFTVFAKGIIPYNAEKTLENYISIISANLKEQTSEEELTTKVSFVSLMDKMFFLRYMPLLFKSFISKLGRGLAYKSKQTLILSNLGIVKIDEDGDKIDHMLFNLNCSRNTPINMAVATYKNKTNISFSRKLIPTDLEKDFIRQLTDFGLEVTVSSNYREMCDVL